MLWSAWYVGYKGQVFDYAPFRVLLPALVMFVVLSSLAKMPPTVRSDANTNLVSLSLSVVLSVSALTILLLVAETATFVNDWRLGNLLVWWRGAVIVLFSGWLLLYVVEKFIYAIHSKPETVLPRR